MLKQSNAQTIKEKQIRLDKYKRACPTYNPKKPCSREEQTVECSAQKRLCRLETCIAMDARVFDGQGRVETNSSANICLDCKYKQYLSIGFLRHQQVSKPLQPARKNNAGPLALVRFIT